MSDETIFTGTVIRMQTLQITNISRNFGSRTAVDNVSFGVEPGQSLALLGTNGSGKSTTMKMCAGVLAPATGDILIEGTSLLTQTAKAKKSLGFVPDVGGLFPRLSGMEHLELAGKLFRIPAWRKRAEYLLKALDLESAQNLRASGYSHGMARKLSTGIALMSSPPLLLLDEPFDGVDPEGAEAITNLIFESKKNGSAVLITTHLLDIAETMCDSVAVMKKSRLIQTPLSMQEFTKEYSLKDAYARVLSLNNSEVNEPVRGSHAA